MPTRADLRTMARQRLEDTTEAPLWDDGTLNQLLTDATRHYGARVPAERSLVAIVPDGATSVAIEPALQGPQVVRVADPSGYAVPRLDWEMEEAAAGYGQAWRWWAGTLLLARPAIGGNWAIDYLDRREMPADDLTPVDIVPGDEEIVVLLAVAGALLRRAVEDGKRGTDRRGLAFARVAERHERTAEALIAARRKRARPGWLGR